MDEFLTFEATDVELIGDIIEMDEEVQRGEKVRFYTLNEQVNDAFEHMIPKGRTTRAQLEKIDKEVDRIRELYTSYVAETAEGFDVIAPKLLRSFPWISPVTDAKEYTPYDYAQWIPLFAKDAIRQPNGYTRMLTSLPSPYQTDVGVMYPVKTPTEFVDRAAAENKSARTSHRVLPVFVMNKTRRHEDGRLDVMPFSVDGTADPSPFVGYWLEKRPLDIPDPLAEHPFLSSNEARFIETTEPLSDVVPELDAVMMHGVPVTQDPYTEGRKYLAIYDIKLESVPWELWKQRFPKKEFVDVMPPPIDMKLPEGNPVPPSSNVVEQYGQPYFPGVASRKWLMTQEDGGHLVVKMIQSLAGNSGTVELLPVAELGDLRFPEVDDDQCVLVGKTFNDFALQGVIRQVGPGKRRCIPLDIVKQERHQIGYRNRMQWKESTPRDILAEYTRALNFYRASKPERTEVKYEKAASRPTSQLRSQVVAILGDEERFPEDKLKAIQVLTRDAPRTRVTVDAEGLFVICDHTIAMLAGDMARDRLAFYDKWTARVDGSRICTVCGEEVNKDVLVNQEDFSEEGRALVHASALETQTFHGYATATYTTQLRGMKDMLDTEDPAEGTLFLLISLLQILPAADQLLPIIQEARALAGGLKPRDRDGKARGMVGIAATVILIQTHMPRLVARRSFGPTPIKMDGYPRDTDSDKAPTVIDSLFTVLRKTFEAYPTSFKGPSVAVMRGVLSDAPAIRKGVIAVLKRMLPSFSASLLRAKSEAIANPAPAPLVGLIPTVLPPATLGTVTSFPQCTGPRSVWADSTVPMIRQPSVPLDPIRFRPSSTFLPKTAVNVRAPGVPDTKDIQRRIKLPAVAKSEGDSWRTNLMIAQRLKNAFGLDIDVSVDTTQKPSLLRDISEGLLKEVMSTIVRNPEMRRAYDQLRGKDITLFALLASLKEARTETNTLRAKERHLFTDHLREMTDSQRQITKDLLDRGMAPYIITNEDRDMFAQQLERELEPLMEPDIDVGVGAPRDAPDDDDKNVDHGDYGDHTVQGNRERDRDTDILDERGPI
jgi:hypothetical protein